MASITLRQTKGTPLTNAEIDANFTNLNDGKLETNGSGANITNLNASNISSGTLAVARGGTGQTTYTNGQLLIGNTTGNTLTKATLTASTNIEIANGNGSISISTSATPSFTSVTTTGAATIAGNVAVNGGSITTTATTFNLVNTTATTVNIAGGATGALNIGNATGPLTIRSSTVVGTQATQALYNTIATTLNFAGQATTLNIGAANGSLVVPSSYTIGSTATTAVTLNISNSTTASGSTKTINFGTGGASGSTTAITIGSTTTGAITNITIGSTAATSTTTINSPTVTLAGDLTINGGDLITTSSFNFAAAATSLSIGAATGTATVNNTTLAAKAITASTTLTVTGNTSLSTVSVSGNITQGTAVHAVPSGSAPLFSARAWAYFNPLVTANKTGTVTRVSGSTTATVTITNHGLLVGHVIYVAAVTGGVTAGIYDVASVIDANNFTITTTGATGAIAAGTSIILNFATINAQGNINSVTMAGAGYYWVNFSTAMPNINYAIMGCGTGNIHLSENPTVNATPRRLMSVHVGTAAYNAWSNVLTSIVIMC